MNATRTLLPNLFLRMISRRGVVGLGLVVLALSAVVCVCASSVGAQESRFRRGDANVDAAFDLSDPLTTLSFLFDSVTSLSCRDAADTNDDGQLDISDPTQALNYLFLGGPPPAAPGFQCGVDPTPDTLGCQAYTYCAQDPVGSQTTFETPIQSTTPFERTAFGDVAVPGAPEEPQPTNDDSSNDAQREIEEADLFKIEGDRIFALNRYRGLQIIDISDLDAPEIIGQAAIFGYPFEMYVRDNTAYVLVSDFFDFFFDEEAFVTRGTYGSQVRVVDISDERAPRVVRSLDLDGYLSDSRIVGDVLYLVSQHYPWHYRSSSSVPPRDMTRVLSVGVGEPSSVGLIDQRDFPRNGWQHHLYVTPETIYLSSSGWEQESRNYETQLRYVDISHPGGLIDVRGQARAPGLVQDRWSMDEHDGVLRVASGETWGNGDIHLSTFSVDDPDEIEALGKTTLEIDERLTAARFDAERGYLVSYRNIDPLFVFDLSNPERPRLLGELEMTGWLDFMIPMGNRILALGHEDLFDELTGRRDISLAVSLIDVENGARPQLLSRVSLDGLWGFVPGDRDDFAKVFRTVPSEGLVLFPFQAWSESYEFISGVQLIDFDTETLDRRGLIDNAGYVERGIPHGNNTVLTLSDQVFQAVNIADRDKPKTRGSLELARNVQDFALLGDDHTVQFSGDWNLGNTRLTVTPVEDPNAAKPTASLDVPAPQGRMFNNGPYAYIAAVEQSNDPEDEIARRTTVQVVDLSDPSDPTKRGAVALPEEIAVGYRSWYWGFGDEVVQVDGSTLAFHRFQHVHIFFDDCLACRQLGAPIVGGKREQEIRLVDLSDPDRPRLGATVTLKDTDWGWGLEARGTTLYLSTYRSEVKEDGAWVARYFLHRIDVSDPHNPVQHAPVNIPGMFADVSDSGSILYTLEDRWDARDRRSRTFLYALELIDDKAHLLSRVELDGNASGIEISGAAAFATTSQWGPFLENGEEIYRHKVALVAVDLSDPARLRLASETEIPIDYAYLQKVDDGRAFVGSGPGVLVYGVNNIERPRLERFFRTQGWVQDIVVQEDTAFLPSGWYGVQVLDLR